jgi:ribosomal-protein-alanine N-acetyltransferase
VEIPLTICQTERLTLRQLAPGDAAFMLRLLNEPTFLQHIGDRKVRTLPEAERYLAEGAIASYARHGHGMWLVALRETGQAIGICGLLRREQFPDVDVGYALLPEFSSRGYASEAVTATLGVARRLGLRRVTALVSPGNAASIRLLEKQGFAPAGRAFMDGDARQDEVLVFALPLP